MRLFNKESVRMPFEDHRRSCHHRNNIVVEVSNMKAVVACVESLVSSFIKVLVNESVYIL